MGITHKHKIIKVHLDDRTGIKIWNSNFNSNSVRLELIKNHNQKFATGDHCLLMQ